MNVDLYRYDEAWEQKVAEVMTGLFEIINEQPEKTLREQQASSSCLKPKAGVDVLDLRKATDFARWRLPGSVNLPLESLNSTKQSPFSDSAILESQWRELESIFSGKSENDTAPSAARSKGRCVLLLCYDGDTSRVGTSILRAKGVEAVSLRGGMHALQDFLPALHVTGTMMPVAVDQIWKSLSPLATNSVDCRLVA